MKKSQRTTAKSQPYHHGNLKEALKEEALAILREQGFDGLSLRALAGRVGVSQTAIYRHFSDKSALLAALAIDGFTGLTAKLSSPQVAAHTELREKIVEMGLEYIRFFIAHRELFHLMFNAAIVDHKEYPELEEAGDKAFDALMGVVVEGIESGYFGPVPDQVMGTTCWAMVHGYVTVALQTEFLEEHCIDTDPFDLFRAGLGALVEGFRKKG